VEDDLNRHDPAATSTATIPPYEVTDHTKRRRMSVLASGLVVDAEVPVGPFNSIGEAFAEVLARGGRVHLRWERTLIGGQTRSADFAARFEDDYAGRVYCMDDASHADVTWRGFAAGHNPVTNRLGTSMGMFGTKEQAVAWVEFRYTLLMASPDASVSHG